MSKYQVNFLECDEFQVEFFDSLSEAMRFCRLLQGSLIIFSLQDNSRPTKAILYARTFTDYMLKIEEEQKENKINNNVNQ